MPEGSRARPAGARRGPATPAGPHPCPRAAVTLARRLTAAVAVMLLAAVPAAGQIVRGTVTERGSGEPLPGVVVALESPAGGDATPRSVLSDASGQFAVRAPAGTWRLTAKRIGVQRFVSEPFALAVGQTVEMAVTMEALVFELPAVRVLDTGGMCVDREADRQRIAALWDEARTALTAAALSQRDRLFQGSITRYTRRLDPRSLRVLEDSWSELVGTYDRTFTSPSGDSLSRAGYWRTVGTDVTYHAPDGDVLLSRAFQRDHCFAVVEGQRDRGALVGVAFTPLPTRKVPDIRGTLWLDARTFALQFVEFGYTQLPEAPNSERIGGELWFSRLASGAWVPARWFVRMPEYIAGTDPSAPVVMTRPVIRALIEEGGMAFGPGLRLFTAPAVIAGVVRDSAGTAFPGIPVRLAGTPYATVADSSGAFRLDSLPAGHFTLLAEAGGYEAVGTAAAEMGLDLREGATEQVVLRAWTAAQLAERFCPGQRLRRDRGMVRVLARDAEGGRPLANLAVWLRWVAGYAGRGEGITARPEGEERRTDDKGAVTFCDVPAGTPLTLSAVNALGRPGRDSMMVRAAAGTVTPALLRTRRP